MLPAGSAFKIWLAHLPLCPPVFVYFGNLCAQWNFSVRPCPSPNTAPHIPQHCSATLNNEVNSFLSLLQTSLLPVLSQLLAPPSPLTHVILKARNIPESA